MKKLAKAFCCVLVIGLALYSSISSIGITGGESDLQKSSKNKTEGLEIAAFADAMGPIEFTKIDFSKTETAENDADSDDEADGNQAEDAEEAEEEFDATGYALAINGEDIVYLADETDARAVVAGIIEAYQTPGSEIKDLSIAEEITYQEKHIVTAEEAAVNHRVSETYICKVDEAVRYILNGTSTPLTYTIQGGDTLWDIAKKNGIPLNTLIEMNPGADKRLSIGQEINLYETNPFVHVSFTETVTTTVTIPYKTEYTPSDTLYKGQTLVETPGHSGSKQVVSEVKKVNGVVQESSLISEEILEEPVTQIALAGTKTITVKSGSGVLQSPTAHVEISSPYGASRSGGKRRHLGIDLRNPKGTPFVAADGGTVIQAGWGGGSFGNLIVIDHGGGVVTKYAHCDSINVTVGQNVSKGEVIGTVGRTGNATGYVLHFEVLVNGSNVNPANYI